MKKVNIVLPVYNESEAIEAFNSTLFGVIERLKERYLFEIVYVLDKSDDDSLDRLKIICKSYPNVKVLSLSRRFGHQMSLVAGMDSSDGDAVIMMDSDLQHPPELIPSLLAKYEEGYDIVHTNRIDSSEINMFKRATSKLFYKFINLIAPVRISPNSADFRLISNKVLRIFQNHIREQNQFLRGLFYWVGYNSASVDFVARKREKGRSKYNFVSLLKFASIGIISFSKVPLRISVLVGIIVSILSFIYGIFSLTAFFLTDRTVHGWTSLITFVTFVGGVQLIFIGLIGEYIGNIFDEVKGRPLYIIENVYKGEQAGK